MLNLSLSQSSPPESLYDLLLGATATRLGGDQLAGPAAHLEQQQPGVVLVFTLQLWWLRLLCFQGV